MKLVLEKVKIYGYDPAVYRTFTGEGKETKQYSVALYITQEQRNQIDSYIYGKCELTRDNEIVFYGKSKQPIPVFDAEKKRIEKPINEVFIADVSILIDEFTPKDGGDPIRYTKCLGIRYISPVANEAPRVIVQEKFETYDEIFGESENKNELSTTAPKDDISQMFDKPREIASEPPKDDIYTPTIPEGDDLPF